ncbi:ATP-dependent DNA helicase [Nanobdella aerobiophila]|uniref:ATP-dependent DNA helicase n=1 Tax=Nanobdella aerobiophila TaxID=2586965 RepID=A0A915SA34_9ARCH|nr:DEAD/DEAH box helicase family protein [Nanobdella aerobiophila]BBL45472.1 ATP-dependent DNA helicase [Nanobdella aerobiophila]
MLQDYYPILNNRPYQIDVIEKIIKDIADNKRYILVDSPTGSGKTLISLIVADLLSKKDKITHIGVRTTEEIKRFLEDSEKLNIYLKIFPNKKKTCPLFINSNLSGEEIICSDCIYKKALYETDILYDLLKRYNYDFKKLTKMEAIKIDKKDFPKCIYQSFKKIDSNIYISTYPYIFNQYLNEILSLDGDPDFLIMDEAHNLLTTILNPYSLSIKRYIEKSFKIRGEQNLLFQDLIKEFEMIKESLNISDEDYYNLRDNLVQFSDQFLSYIENIFIKKFNTEDINIIKSRINSNIKEIYIDKKDLNEIFDLNRYLFDNLSFYWETYKRYISKNNLQLPKKKWNINKFIKLYTYLSDKNIFWIMNSFKLEGYITKFEEIIKSFDNYKSIILMSGSNFSKDNFSKLYKVDPNIIDYIKVNVNFGKKEYDLIYNFSSRFSLRNDKRNIENLISDIKLISENFDKYQLYMFPSYSFMLNIYNKLDIKDIIFLDDGEKSLNKILKTDKKIVFTYSRSRYIEGIQLVKNNRSLLKVIVIVGKPYPPPPNASILINKIIKDNNIDYRDLSEILKDINIKQVIGRAIRYPEDTVKIFFIDDRYRKMEMKRYI